MQKEKQKKVIKKINIKNLSEEQQNKIRELRKQVFLIKNQGSFKTAYLVLRKQTVLLNKSDLSENERKVEIIKVMEQLTSELKKSLNLEKND